MLLAMLTARDITTGERLLLDRRRRQETKANAAVRFSVSLYYYARLEMDKSTGAHEIPRPALGRVNLHESSFLLRRRAGISVTDFARVAGVSAWWLTKMEHGRESPNRLESFWAPILGRAKTPAKLVAALRRKAG